MAGTYICDPTVCTAIEGPKHKGNGGGICWHEDTWYRLRWLYGESMASTISLGLDARTQKDIEAWNAL